MWKPHWSPFSSFVLADRQWMEVSHLGIVNLCGHYLCSGPHHFSWTEKIIEKLRGWGCMGWHMLSVLLKRTGTQKKTTPNKTKQAKTNQKKPQKTRRYFPEHTCVLKAQLLKQKSKLFSFCPDKKEWIALGENLPKKNALGFHQWVTRISGSQSKCAAFWKVATLAFFFRDKRQFLSLNQSGSKTFFGGGGGGLSYLFIYFIFATLSCIPAFWCALNELW